MKPSSTTIRRFPCISTSAGGKVSDGADEAKFRGARLRSSSAFDYVSVRWSTVESDESLGQVGEPCAKANRNEVCVKQLELETSQARASLAADCAKRRGCTQAVYALVTRGDAIQVLTKPADFRRLLVPISSPEAAWLLAQVELGASPQICGDDTFAAYRATSDGYERRERRYTKRCEPLEKTEFIYHIQRDGVALEEQTVLESTPLGCEAPTAHPN